MSELYINKKIDSLGRIVIPKEIRKKLRILENESLDITCENDQVIIKKSSEDLFDKKIFEYIIDSIKKVLSIDISIFNINKIYYGKLKLDEKEFKEFLINKKLEFKNYIIFPFYPNGILYGGILVNIKDVNEYKFVLESFRNFTEKYLEE